MSTSSAIGQLSEAVVTLLQGYDLLTDTIDGMVILPTGVPIPPFVRLGEKTEKNLRTFSTVGTQASIAIEIAVPGATDDGAMEAYGLIKTLLEAQPLPMVSRTIVQKDVTLEKTSVDADGVTWRVFARLDATL
ncbi:MAG: hypothetical protein JWM27_1542 [Gemmatimonadetes bacterium]|nr:hypothetical protein [Gemmatimonadota bacterium]